MSSEPALFTVGPLPEDNYLGVGSRSPYHRPTRRHALLGCVIDRISNLACLTDQRTPSSSPDTCEPNFSPVADARGPYLTCKLRWGGSEFICVVNYCPAPYEVTSFSSVAKSDRRPISARRLHTSREQTPRVVQREL